MLQNIGSDKQMAVVDGVKGSEVKPDSHLSPSSIKMLSASSSLRLRLYPATVMEIGSPRGAICSTRISSPGTQPISISLRKRSFFSNECILAMVPGSNSDNLFILSLLWGGKIMTIPSIQFNFLNAANLKDRTRLRKFIGQQVKKEGKKLGTLNYIFCSDE